MNLQLITRPRTLPDCLVLGLFEEDRIGKHSFISLLPREDLDYLRVARTQEKVWNDKSTKFLPLPSRPAKHVLLLGLGSKKQWNSKKARLAVRRAIAVLKEKRIGQATLNAEDLAVDGITPEDTLRLLAENALMADFAFLSYKEEPKEGWPKLRIINIVVDRVSPKIQKALREGVIIGEAVNHCRMLANTPGGDMTPTKLAQAAQKEKAPKLRVRALSMTQIAKLRMGGILGVSKGSKEKPRFIIMEYRGGRATEKPLVFVGKGVTFDTGGLNLKPDASLYEMHMDMSGGAAVISAVGAIARLRLPINITGLIPAVENMPSGSSYHPGDVLRTITGKTIEVLNTDAEGRIVLADALGYAQRLKPQLMIDVATLTGAAVVALGQRAIALFTSKPELEAMGRDVGEVSGDVVWPMPLWDEYLEDIQGTFGDVANIGKTRYGGAISGAIFLKQFTDNYPWMHLDIAPTMTTIEGQYLTKGASGTGVRFLIEVARRYANTK